MFSVGDHETARLIGMSVEEALLPKFDYHIDESDPDVVVLRRQDGAFVAAFSAKGVTRSYLINTAQVIQDAACPHRIGLKQTRNCHLRSFAKHRILPGNHL